METFGEKKNVVVTEKDWLRKVAQTELWVEDQSFSIIKCFLSFVARQKVRRLLLRFLSLLCSDLKRNTL